MPTPDHLFLVLGFIMITCLSFFVAFDPRICWMRIIMVIAMTLAMVIMVMFALTVLLYLT